MRRISMVLVGLLLAVSGRAFADGPPPLPLPRSGSMTWFDWKFEFTVGEKSEGLELKNVRFKGTKVLHKASMPVVRVKYRGDGESKGDGCGPFNDQIDWSCNIGVVDGALTKVVARIFDNTVLEVAVFAEIGGYDLYQAWYFHPDGRLQPMLHSKGWSCCEDDHEKDHKHHPYWRLDFDVEGVANQVWQMTTVNGNTVSNRQDLEGNGARTSNSALAWKIMKSSSSKHAVVQYPGNELRDGVGSPWFSFSTKDAAWRRYRASEDVGWDFDWDQHLGYKVPAEPINGKDLVFWSIGHLSHVWGPQDELFPEWHHTGPVIELKGF